MFTTYEKLETCQRTEVTVDNLHLLAQHFGGTAIYTVDPAGNWQERHQRLVIPRPNGKESVIEVGAWVDEGGSRWNPEPLTQGWSQEGTYVRTDEQP